MEPPLKALHPPPLPVSDPLIWGPSQLDEAVDLVILMDRSRLEAFCRHTDAGPQEKVSVPQQSADRAAHTATAAFEELTETFDLIPPHSIPL